MKATAGISATVADVVGDPKRLQIIQRDAAQLPRSLDDFDAAAINASYAVQAGFVPTKDAIAIEAAKNPYANVLAVRTATRTSPGCRGSSRRSSRPR